MPLATFDGRPVHACLVFRKMILDGAASFVTIQMRLLTIGPFRRDWCGFGLSMPFGFVTGKVPSLGRG